MMKIISCIVIQHDIGLVVLAGILCTFGSWVTSRLHRHARTRENRQAVPWHLLSALTAGISIWCTHFVAMLGFRPDVPVGFDLGLTFASLVIAVLGCGIGIFFAAMVRMRFAAVIGGAILGLAISGMHYVGMIAYRLQGIIYWDKGYLAASILLAVVFSALAFHLGRKSRKYSEYQMAGVLTVAIVSLHFTGMAAFSVAPLNIAGDFVNPEAFRILALAISGTAILIVMGGLFSYVIEVRTRMESIAELTAARNAAESASRAKSEFMSVLSHELRTPLTIVLGYAGMLSKIKETHAKDQLEAVLSGGVAITPLGDQAELYGRKISTAAQHLLTLINEILDYTSMELGDTKLHKTSFSVPELFQEIADQFQGLARQKSVALRFDCDQIIAFADRSRCLQILINLMGNALKFSKAEEIVLRARFQNSGFTLEVEDNGCGMPKESLEQIFIAFQQLEAADNRKEGGTGLGLAICKKLAIAHGGDVSVRSDIGAGTTFTVTLPESAIDRTEPEANAREYPESVRLAG